VKKNHYTILISPPKAGRTKHFSLSKRFFYFSLIFLLILIIGNYIAVFKYQESTQLSKENTKLKAEKEEMEKVIQIIDQIKKEETFIRNFLGLEKSGTNMGGEGLEKVDPPYIDTSSTPPLATDISLTSSDESEVSPIARARGLKKDLQELIDELIDRKSEWNTKPTILPVASTEYFITSGFGWRNSPFTGLREFHRGLDISAKRGTPVIAPADGTVKECEKDLHLGKFIRINHDNKLATLYGHLLQQNVKVGQNVKRGDLIGLVGNSGMSTGYHLHYEVCKDSVSINPYQHILNLNTSSTMMAMQ